MNNENIFDSKRTMIKFLHLSLRLDEMGLGYKAKFSKRLLALFYEKTFGFDEYCYPRVTLGEVEDMFKIISSQALAV